MNKSQLIEVIATKADISKVKASAVVDAFVGAVTESLRGGDQVTLIGFGSFSTVKRAARVGRNPKTGKPISINAYVQPKFSAGATLKSACNKNKKK